MVEYSKPHVAFMKGKERKTLDIGFVIYFYYSVNSCKSNLFTYLIFDLSLNSSFFSSSLIHFSVRK